MDNATEKTINPKALDSELWHALAGPLVCLPPVNSTVFYIPEGHAEHANCPQNFPLPGVARLVLCRVTAVEFLADSKTDEVFAKISLVPTFHVEDEDEDEGEEGVDSDICFDSKVLTQSDANNGGGFSVPRPLAEKIFPPLDYEADPPVQELLPVDVHGEAWRFKHIYRGTPRRHLFTTGWSRFVNAKRLIAGDSLLFMMNGKGLIRVGIKRGKCRYENDGAESCRVKPEDVLEAVALAAAGRPFEVVYDPCTRSGKAAEFVVRVAAVKEALDRVPTIRAGTKFTMWFEDDDDPSRTKSFHGTIVSAKLNTPWKSLQVDWGTESDEEIKNVSHVSAWQIEMESQSPPIVNFTSLVSPIFANPTRDVSKGGMGRESFSHIKVEAVKSKRNFEQSLSDSSNTTTKTLKLFGKQIVVTSIINGHEHEQEQNTQESSISSDSSY